MNALVQDLRYAVRTLWKSPGFTLVAVITLALGIGATAAIFSVVDAVLLRPLPYRDAGRLVRVDEVDQKGEFEKSGIALLGVSPPDFLDFREQSRSFEQLAAFTRGSYVLTGGKQPQRLEAVSTTANLFTTVGVRPAMGRDFVPEDELAGRRQVTIISHSMWQQLFGGAADVVGRTISLDTNSYVVIGVMPRGFQFPVQESEVVLWTPLEVDPKVARSSKYLDAIGRLKPGISVAQAKSDLDVIAARGDTQVHWTTMVIPFRDSVVSQVRSPLLILAAAVGFVLLIAAANVASLCLSRAATRQKEVAVRLALGATRARLVRQLLTESVLLSLLGAGCGVLLAMWTSRALTAIAPPALPRIGPIGIDTPVLWFTFVVSVFTGVGFGLAPALKSSRGNVGEVMKEGGSSFRPGHQPLHTSIVVGEIALAAVLLCAAGLMIRTLMKLHGVDPGFDARQVLTAEVNLAQRYPEEAQRRAFYDAVLARFQSLPGVESAAATTNLPMSGTRMAFHLRITRPGQPELSVVASFRTVSPDYFRTMHIPLVRGRAFTAQDTPSSAPVGIINESLARQLWPNEDPVGKKFPAAMFTKQQQYIVGVVRDVHEAGLDAPARPELIAPISQMTPPFMRFVIRTHADSTSLAAALRAQVLSVDPNQSLDKIAPLESLLRNSTAERRFYMLLLSTFAALALALAAVGVFGVVSYAVTQRTREIGVRMALGAGHSDVMRMMLARGFLPCVTGLAIGIVGALAATRVMSKLLFGVRPTDAVTFVGLTLVLGGIALVASYLPARRASKVDPMVALRYE